MGGKFGLFVIVFLMLIIFSNVSMSGFAEDQDLPTNNTFIGLNSLQSPSCGGEFEFRTIQVTPNNTDKNNADFSIKVSSLFFNVTQGVLGSGFTDTKITNLSQPYDANYMVKCYDISGDSKMENKLSIIKGDEKINSLYKIKINGSSIGQVTPTSLYFDSQKPTEKNSSFLIITGSDACGSYGAYRMVNVNFKESSDQQWTSEIDIYSLFFDKATNKTTGLTSYPILGNGTISSSIEGSVELYSNNTKSYVIQNSWGLTEEKNLDEEIKLDNDIKCKDEKSQLTDEKFGITIKGDGGPNLNLPPIRPKN